MATSRSPKVSPAVTAGRRRLATVVVGGTLAVGIAANAPQKIISGALSAANKIANLQGGGSGGYMRDFTRGVAWSPDSSTGTGNASFSFGRDKSGKLRIVAVTPASSDLAEPQFALRNPTITVEFNGKTTPMNVTTPTGLTDSARLVDAEHEASIFVAGRVPDGATITLHTNNPNLGDAQNFFAPQQELSGPSLNP